MCTFIECAEGGGAASLLAGTEDPAVPGRNSHGGGVPGVGVGSTPGSVSPRRGPGRGVPVLSPRPGLPRTEPSAPAALFHFLAGGKGRSDSITRRE